MRPDPVDIAGYCDHAFEASQRALATGDVEGFKRAAQQHRGLAELYHYVRAGGLIH